MGHSSDSKDGASQSLLVQKEGLGNSAHKEFSNIIVDLTARNDEDQQDQPNNLVVSMEERSPVVSKDSREECFISKKNNPSTNNVRARFLLKVMVQIGRISFFIDSYGRGDVLDYVEDHDMAALKGRLDSSRIMVAIAEDQSCLASVVIESVSDSFRVEVKEDIEVPSDEWIGEIGRVSSGTYGVDVDGTVGGMELVNLSVFVEKGLVGNQRSGDEVSSVVVGKEIRCVDSLSGYSLSSDEDGFRPGSPCRLKLGLVDSLVDTDKNQRSCKDVGQSALNKNMVGLGDLIVDSLAAMPPLGHCLFSPKELFADLGSVRGVNLAKPNSCYGEDRGWCVEKEVAKVLETNVALGLKFNGNPETLRKEITSRDEEDREHFRA
ncbi:hypothetical protein LWI29_035579 [Acer saccharum]|uniref:Uncharacterized protein n=1 Tax=Acer saccharum TaxID=4024 RepID=A0AA39SDM4_ACESA|nr:hypothetical protein LWI29_035579 [Acer saccharum]